MKAFLTAAVLAALVTSSAYAHRSNKMDRVSGNVVYGHDGTVIGQDPDPNVRLQLRRDFGSWEW